MHSGTCRHRGDSAAVTRGHGHAAAAGGQRSPPGSHRCRTRCARVCSLQRYCWGHWGQGDTAVAVPALWVGIGHPRVIVTEWGGAGRPHGMGCCRMSSWDGMVVAACGNGTRGQCHPHPCPQSGMLLPVPPGVPRSTRVVSAERSPTWNEVSWPRGGRQQRGGTWTPRQALSPTPQTLVWPLAARPLRPTDSLALRLQLWGQPEPHR